MINIKSVKRFCCENISLIENYEKALNDESQTWDCHHRNEILLNKTKSELKNLGLYWNRPANELIFLTHSDHMSLHNSGNRNPMYGNGELISGDKHWLKNKGYLIKGEKNGFYNHHHTEESKKKMSEKKKGVKQKPRGEEYRQNLSKSLKGKMAGDKHPQYGWKWVCTDNEKPKKIPPELVEEYLNNGWHLGRK